MCFIFRHMTNYRPRLLDDTIAITKALADQQRLRALMALRDGELCACQLAELLRLANSTVSKHMSILRQARLVAVRRNGRWSYFRRIDGKVSKEATDALNWLDRTLARAPQIEADARRVADIKRLDPEELCRMQSRK